MTRDVVLYDALHDCIEALVHGDARGDVWAVWDGVYVGLHTPYEVGWGVSIWNGACVGMGGDACDGVCDVACGAHE